MSSKDSMLSVTLKKFGDKLIYMKGVDETIYKEFVNSLEQGHVVHAFFDANSDDGTLAQLAKVHACIRELAKETGYSFEDMKLEIKKASGLCIIKEIDGEKFLYCKSFGDCSKSELSLAMEAIIERGDFVKLNFR